MGIAAQGRLINAHVLDERQDELHIHFIYSMAKIFISYQRDDLNFVSALAEDLKSRGHQLSYDVDELSAGTEWRTALNNGLKNSEIFIVVVSKSTQSSQSVLSEVGAARAYASDSGRMLLVPIVIDQMPLPLAIQDIQAIIQPDRDLTEIVPKIERAISVFIGRRAAKENEEIQTAQKIQNKAASFINVAIDSLSLLEARNRWFSQFWYIIGFSSLVLGIGFSILGLSAVTQQHEISLSILAIVILKAIVVIGLLGACAKYAFTLGKSYSSESLKSSDRIHAIRFGEFYLNAFGDKTQWEQLKEVFQHWNIDRNSSFSNLEPSQFDPKIVESILEFAKVFAPKKSEKSNS